MAEITEKTVEPDSKKTGNALDRFFKISERGSTIGTEIRGGLVNFFAMCYIIVLNPLILGTTPDSTGAYLGGGDQPNLGAIAAVTALVAGVLTILMGSVANFPMAMAAGLGLNALVAYTIVKIPGVTWADGMGLIVLEGILILILVVTKFRSAVFKAVPAPLKIAISVGIGLFIAFIGVVNSGLVQVPSMFDYYQSKQPGTPVQLGTNHAIDSLPLLVFVIGLALIILLTVKKVKGAMLIGIISATVIAVVIEYFAELGPKHGNGELLNDKGWNLNAPVLPDSFVQLPDLSVIGEVSLTGAIKEIGIVAALLWIFSLLLADFFDTMGTMVAVGGAAKLLDEEGNPPNSNRILIVDSLGAIAGGAAGVSSNTAYIESASGAGEGARTGFASVVTGVTFLVAAFFAPLVNLVPYEAATPALVFVGFLMVSQITGINWKDLEIALPAFLTIVLMPFTYSITTGIGAGFIFFVLIKLVLGKAKQIHPLMWVAAGMFVLYFTLGPIQNALS